MKNILEVENISKAYSPLNLSTAFNKAERERRTLVAVDNVSFNIKEGEIYGLLGPNGAGKSTIIKMITGLIRKDGGKVYINGHDIDKERREASSSVGAIIEAPSMFSKMSAIDNLKYFASLEGKVDIEEINRSLEIVGLQDRAKDKVGTYSLGMKQRLGIAQAIMNKPRLLILDEPTNGLDPEWIIAMRDLIKSLAHEHNVSVMVSSHILGEMQELCDRVGILDHGKLMMEISVEDIGKLHSGMKTHAAITVDDEQKTLAKVSELGYKALINKGRVYVELFEDDIPNINKALVDSDIKVYGIEVKKRTLEDLFKDIIHGKVDTLKGGDLC